MQFQFHAFCNCFLCSAVLEILFEMGKVGNVGTEGLIRGKQKIISKKITPSEDRTEDI